MWVVTMTVNGNVIRCDECGRQLSVPMETGAGRKKSFEDRVRAFAIGQGWTCGYGVDFCPGVSGIVRSGTPGWPLAGR